MRRPNSQRILTLSILSLTTVGLCLVGCSQKTEISVILPLSGEYSAYGESSLRGIELALEEWRQTNTSSDGITIDIVDSKSEAQIAQQQLEAAFERGVFAAIGGLTSPEAASMIPVAESYERVLISPWASSADLTRKSAFFYRLAPSDFVAAGKIAEFALRELRVKNALVVVDALALAGGATAGFQAAFEAHQGKVSEIVEWGATAPDALATQIHAASPDAVYVAAYEKRLAALVLALHQQGYDGHILTTQAIAPKASRVSLGQNAEGLVFTQPSLSGDDASIAANFQKAYQAAYGEAPDVLAAQSYDTLRVLLAAVGGAEGFPSKVRDGFRDAVLDFPGATGALQFNDHGESSIYPRVFQVDNGQVVDYAEKIENEKIQRRKERDELRRRLAQLRQEMSSS